MKNNDFQSSLELWESIKYSSYRYHTEKERILSEDSAINLAELDDLDEEVTCFHADQCFCDSFEVFESLEELINEELHKLNLVEEEPGLPPVDEDTLPTITEESEDYFSTNYKSEELSADEARDSAYGTLNSKSKYSSLFRSFQEDADSVDEFEMIEAQMRIEFQSLFVIVFIIIVHI